MTAASGRAPIQGELERAIVVEPQYHAHWRGKGGRWGLEAGSFRDVFKNMEKLPPPPICHRRASFIHPPSAVRHVGTGIGAGPAWRTTQVSPSAVCHVGISDINSFPPLQTPPFDAWLYVMGVAADTIRWLIVARARVFLDGCEDAASSRCPLRTHAFHR